jgi:hypothetical protein
MGIGIRSRHLRKGPFRMTNPPVSHKYNITHPFGASTTLNPERDFDMPNNDLKRIEIIEIKDFKQTLVIETGLNGWNGHKHTGGSVSLGWTHPGGMYCMLALFQNKDGWGNETCKSLSLLFTTLHNLDPREIPSFSIGKVNHSSGPSRQGDKFTKPVGELTTCTNVIKSSNGNYSALHIPQANV